MTQSGHGWDGGVQEGGAALSEPEGWKVGLSSRFLKLHLGPEEGRGNHLSIFDPCPLVPQLLIVTQTFDPTAEGK